MADPIRTIKKYPNRRLYDTANSGYITLADVKQMVLENIEFQVVDAKTGEDLTRSILLQIILEEESGGLPMFSAEMLSHMIRFYGTAQQTMIGQYMEQNVKAFLAIQKKLQEQAKQIYGDKLLLTPDLWKQFMQMQAPAMQGMLGNYLEQSAKLFMDMQQRMQDQTRGMFSAFPFPGLRAAANRRRGREEALGASYAPHNARSSRAFAAAQARPGGEATARQVPSNRDVPVTTPRRPTSRSADAPRADAAPAVGFVSLGCPKALVDSEQILTQLKAEGYAIAPSYEGADLVVVNTCGFIDAAVDGVARGDRRGVGRQRQGDRHRVPRREARRRAGPRHPPEGARGHRTPRDRRGDGRGAPAPAESPTTRSSTSFRRRA